MRSALAALVAVVFGVAVLGTAAAPGGTSGTLRLHAVFHVGWKAVGCPRGTPTTTSCYLNVGSVAIPAIGKVREHYVLLVEHSDTNCADWRFRVFLTVAGKGSIAAEAFRPGCFSPYAQNGTSSYRITGGSGTYRTARGSGKIVSAGSETGPGYGIGTDTWTGTLTVPGRRLTVGGTTGHNDGALQLRGVFGTKWQSLRIKAPRGAKRTTARSTTRILGELSFSASFPVKDFAAACPPGTPSTTECFAFESTAPVPGLGVVTEKYLAFDDQSDSSCRHTSWSPVVLTVAGKGEIDASLAPAGACDGRGQFVGAGSFAITGGSGIYAGASGTGTENAGSFVSDVWAGALTVPGLAFDTTRPVLHGAGKRTVYVGAGVRHVRVRFTVTAADAVDGPLPVVCRPRSGSSFRLGRTNVSCSAVDSSANEATGSFAVLVKRR